MKKIDWTPALFLSITPTLAAVLVPLYFWFFDLTWPVFALAAFYWLATGMSITAGYHRLFAHRSYEAKSWIKFLYLFFGAAAFQNSALKWATDHRQHHREVDTENDPYTITKGFTYAHIGWMVFKPQYPQSPHPRDLLNDKLVMWQHKNYLSVAIFSCFLLPWAIGIAFGDPIGGLIIAGLLRLVIVHHSTFFVNSLAHVWGTKPYSLKDTARDNIVVAFLTYGEGYHNFHHKFEADYRNGIRWYHFDPTKWWIKTMAWFGQTKKLKQVPEYRILQAKLEAQFEKMRARGANLSQLQGLREKMDATQRRIRELSKEYDILKANFTEQSRVKMQEIRLEMRLAKEEFRSYLRQWNLYYTFCT